MIWNGNKGPDARVADKAGARGGAEMGLLKELSLLIGYVSTLTVILGGIWKALVSIVRQFQRWLDLKESRVLTRQQVAVEKAHAEGFSQGQSYFFACALVVAVVIIFLVLAKSAPQAQA